MQRVPLNAVIKSSCLHAMIVMIFLQRSEKQDSSTFVHYLIIHIGLLKPRHILTNAEELINQENAT